MGDASWLTSALEVADAATQGLGLQEPVTHEAFVLNSGGFGEKSYAAPVPRMALVQRKDGVLRNGKGQDQAFRVVVSFVRPVSVSVRDRITLADGTSGQIIDPQGGLSDPTTGRPFVRVIHLG